MHRWQRKLLHSQKLLLPSPIVVVFFSLNRNLQLEIIEWWLTMTDEFILLQSIKQRKRDPSAEWIHPRKFWSWSCQVFPLLEMMREFLRRFLSCLRITQRKCFGIQVTNFETKMSSTFARKNQQNPSFGWCTSDVNWAAGNGSRFLSLPTSSPSNLFLTGSPNFEPGGAENLARR